MKKYISKVFKLIGLMITLTVTLGFSQCKWSEFPLIFLIVILAAITSKPAPETEAFVRDYQASLGNPAIANRDIPLLVEYRIGPASDPDVCNNGIKYGPFTVSGNSVAGSQTVSADEPTLQLVNSGDTSMCTIITAPVNVTLSASFDKVYLDSEPCSEEAADISGIWQGAYSCTAEPAGMCDIDEGVVTLNILQDEHGASYSSGEASYNGPVCGNRFEFSGGGPGYTESGTFILNNDGSASKTSHYDDTVGPCSGDCSDPRLVIISQQVLLDHFDDDVVSASWALSALNTTDDVDGWSFSESGTNLTATGVTAETIHSDNGQTWSQLQMFRTLDTALGDFIAEFDISWASDDDVTAMQSLHLELHSQATGRLVSAGYNDNLVDGKGKQDALISANQLNSPPTLPNDGSATIKISRSGEITSVHWDGVEIHSGYSYGSLDEVYLTFAHYPYASGGEASLFGSLSVDRIRIVGVEL